MIDPDTSDSFGSLGITQETVISSKHFLIVLPEGMLTGWYEFDLNNLSVNGKIFR